MPEDIRDRRFIGHEDVVKLNFIGASSPYVFRRHYRQGLRSHILEVLHKEDVERETAGTVVGGHRWFPKAKPVAVFRIFRARLKTLEKALQEVNRVKIVERYLATEFLAQSSEFIVDYIGPEGPDLMLCGFQTFTEGKIVDPWSLLGYDGFCSPFYDSLQPLMDDPAMTQPRWEAMVRRKAAVFIDRIKKMILETGYLPDLAGIGNLVIVAQGEIKLVDINNISKVIWGSDIPLDDRGYPVCDKSIEALYLMEEKLLGSTDQKGDKIYGTFFDPQRQKKVRVHEANFHRKKKYVNGYPALRQ